MTHSGHTRSKVLYLWWFSESGVQTLASKVLWHAAQPCKPGASGVLQLPLSLHSTQSSCSRAVPSPSYLLPLEVCRGCIPERCWHCKHFVHWPWDTYSWKKSSTLCTPNCMSNNMTHSGGIQWLPFCICGGLTNLVFKHWHQKYCSMLPSHVHQV